MAATKDDIERWFDEAKLNGATHLIIVCDTFDYEDFPVHVKKVEDFWTTYNLYNKPENMTRIMEVFDMNAPKDEQMAGRAWNCPPKEDPVYGEKANSQSL
jgi:hypothetical protein